LPRRNLESNAGAASRGLFFRPLPAYAFARTAKLKDFSKQGGKMAADPVKVDPKHYRVEFENDRVRVLHVTYGPREKSVMHGHPDAVAVFLTDNRGRFNLPGGKSEERSWTAGQAMLTPAEEHLPENLSDKPLELVLVELKG
jgi:quercetin dioxygenase-like cupin family protein